jgi:hypothetical protein
VRVLHVVVLVILTAWEVRQHFSTHLMTGKKFAVVLDLALLLVPVQVVLQHTPPLVTELTAAHQTPSN